MIRKLYDRTLSLAYHPRALWVLAFVAFLESSFFPIPPDALLIPMIIAAPRKAWILASLTIICSVAGGLFGYLIGAVAFEQIGRPLLHFLSLKEAVHEYTQKFNSIGFWAILIAGVTPFPFKVITIMSGATSMPLGLFVATAIFARSIRFFTVAALLYVYGDKIRSWIERYLGWALFAAFLILVTGLFAMGAL